MREIVVIGLLIVAGLGFWTASSIQPVGFENSVSGSTPDEGQRDGNSASLNPLEGFVPPALHPQDIQLQTQRLAPNVYALVSNHPAVDNAGFVVGEKGVLVIDAHINAAMAQQIQDAVKAVTEKPILFLVNSNYHGDHTFGNYAFPKTTQIVAHTKTAEDMSRFEENKEFMMATVDFDSSVYGDVELRLPDITFDDFLRIDLGGQVVELYHFGFGNTAGDTVTYIPEYQIAWTGNLVVGEGTIPPLFEGHAVDYLQTITNFDETLDAQVIIPGHGQLTTQANLTRYISYLSQLIENVSGAIERDLSLEQTLKSLPLSEEFALPSDIPLAEVIIPFINGLHRIAVQYAYLELSQYRDSHQI